MTNEEYIQTFSDYLINERGYSDLTEEAYVSDLEHFESFLKETGTADFTAVDLTDARIYLGYLNDGGYSRSSISRKISSLRSFYSFLMKLGDVETNPFAYLNLKKRGQALPKFFYEEEMEALFEAAEGSEPLDYRNRALLEVLYGTGIRVSECQQIRLGDLDLQMDLLLVHGKGSKDRYVPFGHFAREALEEYMEKGRQVLMDHHHKDHDFLFINFHGDPISVGGIQYVLNQLIKKSSLTTNITPHKIRHSFATHLLNHGADIRSVQELLGHANLSTTQIYTHLSTENLQESYRNFFPRATED